MYSSGDRVSASLHPAPWVSAGVKYRNNYNAIVFDQKENLIRKAAGQCSAKVLVDKGKGFGCVDNAFKGRIYSQQKLATQPGKTFLVPMVGSRHLRFCRGTDEELAHHFRFLRRCMTAAHGEPAHGSL